MEAFYHEIMILVVAAAAFAWLGTLSHQPILIGYILAGLVAGPHMLNLVHHVELLDGLSQIGTTLLLFLAGMVLHPNRLSKLMGKTLLVTLPSCLVIMVAATLALRVGGVAWTGAAIAGACLMFSSTILLVRLLPTTTLHQRHMGSFCIAILIVQDIIAVLLIMFLGRDPATSQGLRWLLVPVKTVVLVAVLLVAEQFVLRRMMRRSDRYHEVLYMLAMAWCLGTAGLAHEMGLSYEIGAFAGGVLLARNPIARFISDQLVPLRDFFLMFFFFVLGARFDITQLGSIWLPALLTTIAIIGLKPFLFRWLFRRAGEDETFGKRGGIRLGQSSEFGMLMAAVAYESGRITSETAQLIQLIVVLTIVCSSYIVIFTCPTPLGTSKRLKQD